MTDHKALTTFWTQSKLSPILTRWFDKIMAFNFDIVHVEGSKNYLADALSRQHEYDDAQQTTASFFAQNLSNDSFYSIFDDFYDNTIQCSLAPLEAQPSIEYVDIQDTPVSSTDDQLLT